MIMISEKMKKLENKVNYFIEWIGSIASLVIHTILFISCFIVGMIWGNWDTILLILTTIVSLEAIYLAIFIQMSVNRNTESLEGVEKDIDEIQGDIDEIQEDVEDIAEDDEEEESEDEQDRRLLKDIQDNILRITTDLQQLKKNTDAKEK